MQDYICKHTNGVATEMPIWDIGTQQVKLQRKGWHHHKRGRARERTGQLLLRKSNSTICRSALHTPTRLPLPRAQPTHLVPGPAPIKWVGELDEDVVVEGERLPLFLADWTAAVRAGAFGGAAAAAAEEDAGERARSRAAARPAGGGDATCGLGRFDTSGGVLETARMPFFFWRTLAMAVGVCTRSLCAAFVVVLSCGVYVEMNELRCPQAGGARVVGEKAQTRARTGWTNLAAADWSSLHTRSRAVFAVGKV